MKSKSWVKTPSHKILRDPGSKLHVPIIAAIIIFCNSLVASAQEYEVVSFDFALKDLTARSANTSRIDGNGKKCAVLKIYANDNITEAEGNVIGDIIDKGMEKWIYMSRDSKEVKLLFEHHYPLHINFIDYDYPMVSEQMVYIVKLREKPMENENALSTNTQNPNSNPNFPTSDSSRSKDQSPIENQSDLHQKTVIIYSPEKPDSIDGFDNAIEGVIANQMQTKEGYSNYF